VKLADILKVPTAIPDDSSNPDDVVEDYLFGKMIGSKCLKSTRKTILSQAEVTSNLEKLSVGDWQNIVHGAGGTQYLLKNLMRWMRLKGSSAAGPLRPLVGGFRFVDKDADVLLDQKDFELLKRAKAFDRIYEACKRVCPVCSPHAHCNY
jgi:hypothetical protein